MNLPFLLFLDVLTGMVISVMVVANTLYGQAATMGVSLIVNHSIGLLILCSITLIGRKNPAIQGPNHKAPWYLYFNGLFGLAILNLNYLTIVGTGASLAMASTVFGQSASSLVFDLTGWLGMTKRKPSPAKALSLAVSFVGIGVMGVGGDGTFTIPYILLGILAGALTMVQMVLNSTLALYKGAIKASRQNYITGLAAGLVFYFLFQPSETLSGLKTTLTLPLLTVSAGGLLAVFVVVSTSYVIVKIPAVYSALLLSSAQILTSLAIDALFFDTFSVSLLVGSSLMVLGMCGNLLADSKLQSSEIR